MTVKDDAVLVGNKEFRNDYITYLFASGMPWRKM